jgi:hypothetical protein
MTFPQGISDLTAAWKPSERLFRSWLLLAGIFPIDYDDVVFEEVEPGRRFLERSSLLTQRVWEHFEEVEPGRRFLERSSLLTQRVWEHERTIESTPEGCLVTDRVRFVPRLPWLAGLYRPVLRAVFRWRHRNLRSLFGEAAA